MAINNPLIPGDPFSYDLRWIVRKIKMHTDQLVSLTERMDGAETDIEALQGQIAPLYDLYQQIISGLFPDNRYAIQFETTEAMLQTDLKAGSLAHTAGYYTAGDEGGALFYIVETEPATPHLTLDNGLFAEIIGEDYTINVKQFGAKGNASDDDTDIINECIKMAQPIRYTVYLPKGDYVVDTLTIDKSGDLPFWLHLKGQDRVTTVLRRKTAGTILDIVMGTSQRLQYATIENMTMLGTVDGVYGIRMAYCTNGHINWVTFRGLSCSIDMDHCWGYVVENITCRESFSNTYPHIYVKRQCNASMFRNLRLTSQTGMRKWNMWLYGDLSTLSIHDTALEGYGIQAVIQSGVLMGLDIRNLYSEYMEGVVLDLRAQQTGQIRQTNIDEVYYVGDGTPASVMYLSGDIRQTTISNVNAQGYVNRIIDNTSGDRDITVRKVTRATTGPIINSLCHYEQAGTAAPTDGYYSEGSIMWNVQASSGTLCWICTSSGTPGTWHAVPTT